MIRWYYRHRIGYVYCYEDGRTGICNIFGGNCLCVFTQFYKDEKTGKDMEQMAAFFVDEKHLKNCFKEGIRLCPYINTRSIKLNLYYKEAHVLAKYFTMQGYKVSCYYKEPKEEKKKKG